MRYFPESVRRWRNEHPKPANIFSEPETLECEVCGTNLLLPEPSGIFVLWKNTETEFEQGDDIVGFQWCCKGKCDRTLVRRTRAEHGPNIVDGWEDIHDLCVPLIFIQKMMAVLNGFQNGDRWSAEAFTKLKSLLITVFQHVARDTSPDEQERIQRLLQVPDYLGGLGTE